MGIKLKHIIEEAAKIITAIVLGAMLLLLVASVLIQLPFVQNRVCQRVISELNSQIDGRAELDRIYLVLPNRIVIKNISIVSPCPDSLLCDSIQQAMDMSDTLVACHKLSVALSTRDILKGRLGINRLELDNGVFNLNSEELRRTNLERIFKMEKKEKEEKEKSDFSLALSKLKLSRFRFTLKNPFKPQITADSLINWANLRLSNIDVDIKRIRLKDEVLTASIRRIKFKDASGFECRNLSGRLTIDPELATINEMLLSDNWSRLKMDYFRLRYNTAHALATFTDSVSIEAKFVETVFCMKTLRKFSPNLPLCSRTYILNGVADGPIRHMRGKEMSIESLDGNVDMKFSYDIKGLPKVRESVFDIKLNNTSITAEGLSDVLSNFSDSDGLSTIGDLTPGMFYEADLYMRGPLDNFTAGGTISSEAGEVKADIAVQNLISAPKYGISGKLVTNQLDLQTFTGSKTLGICNARAYFNTELVKHSQNKLLIGIDSVFVSQFRLGDYTYSNLMAAGLYDGTSFDGRIICHDPNLNLMCQGVFALKPLKSEIVSGQMYEYKAYLTVPYANLANLHLMNRDSMAVVSFTTNAEISAMPGKFLFGDINISKARFVNEHGTHSLGDIEMNSYVVGDRYTASLNSSFAKAGYQGDVDVVEFIKGMIAKNLYNEIPDIGGIKEQREKIAIDSLINKEMSGTLTVDFGETNSFFATICPEIRMEKGARFTAEIRKDGLCTASFNGKGISYGNNILYYPLIKLDNRDEKTSLNVITSEIHTPVLKMERANLNFIADEDHIYSTFRFRSDSTSNNSAYINAIASFEGERKEININKDSYITLKGGRWNFGECAMSILDDASYLKSFSLTSNLQSINAGGVLGRKTANDEPRDSLYVEMNRFDLNILNSFLTKSIDFRGLVSGKAEYSNLSGTPEMLIDIHADSLSIYRYPVGKIDVSSNYISSRNIYALNLVNHLEGNTRLEMNGIYDPSGEYLDIKGGMNELSASLIEPFIASLFSDIKGNISGDIAIKGPIKDLKIESRNCRINSFNGLFNFTNARYTIDGPVTINEKEILANNLSISDGIGGTGTINGGARHNMFSNVQLDTKIKLENILGLNTRMTDNPQYYGRVFADADIDVTGTLDDININLNVTPSSHSSLHIPLASSSNAVSSNLLTFKKEEFDDSSDDIFFNPEEVKKGREKSNISVNLTANANTLADVYIEINKERGDILHGNGEGVININVNPSKDLFTLLGNYTINEGDYKFVFDNMALASRTFKLKQGGRINFNGGVSDINLDLEAEYNTKAAVNTLISDTTGIASRRSVNCGIGIKGTLSNPDIKVKIDIPDLDPATKARVESALNTEGKVQKQFAALLISGGFVPDESSGITNNSTLLYSNASDIVSNQLNGILKQLGIPLDLGLNYQPDQRGTNIFDVAVSTALFNNRILINGNIGNTNRAADDRDVIGNIDVEVKLDENGKIRLTFFSHAADRYSNYLDNKQRTGIGFSYQKEFNNRHDFFTRRTKEQKEQARLKKMRDKERRRLLKEQMKSARKKADLE